MTKGILCSTYLVMDLTNLIKQSFRKWLEALHTTVKEIYFI